MLASLFPEEKRRLYELEQQLFELDSGHANVQVSDIQIGVQEISLRIESLEQLASKESKSQKDEYRKRIQHLRNSLSHINSSLDNYIKRKAKKNRNFGSQKEELFKGSIDIESSSEPSENTMAESSSLNRSNKMINDYISSGRETLEELLAQRDRLKGVRTKVIDIMNYLGLSSSMMTNVKDREKIDRIIVWGGIALVLLIILFIWYIR